MDKELQNVIKHDSFVESVEVASDYVSHHRKNVLIGIVAVLVLAVVGYFGYTWFEQRKLERQLALGEAMAIAQSTTSRTVDDEKKVTDAFTKVATNYSGTKEGNLASYMLAMLVIEKGDLATGEKKVRELINADKETASLAKFTLAELLHGQQKDAEAEALLRGLIDNPTKMMPKEMATIELGRYLAKSKPDEARKLLEPLRSARAPISTPALEVLGKLPPAPMTPPVKK